jgi:hypothetical protein
MQLIFTSRGGEIERSTVALPVGGSHSSSKSSRKKEYNLLGYNAMQFVECQPTFRRNIPPAFTRFFAQLIFRP